MEVGFWLKGLAGVALGAALICNLPVRLWLPMEKATLGYLAETSLRTLDGSDTVLKVCRLGLSSMFKCKWD